MLTIAVGKRLIRILAEKSEGTKKQQMENIFIKGRNSWRVKKWGIDKSTLIINMDYV